MFTKSSIIGNKSFRSTLRWNFRSLIINLPRPVHQHSPQPVSLRHTSTLKTAFDNFLSSGKDITHHVIRYRFARPEYLLAVQQLQSSPTREDDIPSVDVDEADEGQSEQKNDREDRDEDKYERNGDITYIDYLTPLLDEITEGVSLVLLNSPTTEHDFHSFWRDEFDQLHNDQIWNHQWHTLITKPPLKELEVCAPSLHHPVSQQSMATPS